MSDTQLVSQQKLTLESNPLRAICKHLGMGGDLISWARANDLDYDDVVEWIDSDPIRQRKYDQAMSRRDEWMKERVLAELARIGTSNLAAIFDAQGNLKPIFDWPIELAGSVQQIEVVELFEGAGRSREQVGWTKKIKFWDKVKALELVGKHLAMFTDRVEHEGVIKLEDLIMGAGAPPEQQPDTTDHSDDEEI